MKKLIDKYKLPGHERRATFYVIKHNHYDKKSVQLQAVLDFEQSPKAEDSQFTKRQ